MSGYLVFRAGDTLLTNIRVNPGSPPVDYVEIKKNQHAPVQAIPSDSIQSFHVPDFGKFIAMKVSVPSVKGGENGERYWVDVSYARVILQELVSGESYSLYKLGTSQFFIRRLSDNADSGFDELVNREYGDCCVDARYTGQLIAFLPVGDTYEKVIRNAPYAEGPLKAVVIHLNTMEKVREIARNRKVHFFAGAGLAANSTSLSYETAMPFSPAVAPFLNAGIFWQSSGRYEKILNVLSASYTQFNCQIRGWIKDRYPLPSNTHTVYKLAPKLSFLYRAIEKFKYSVYGGIGASYARTFIASHLAIRPVNSDYFTTRCYTSDALVFSAEAMVKLRSVSVGSFVQLGNSYDIGSAGYTVNTHTSGVLLAYTF